MLVSGMYGFVKFIMKEENWGGTYDPDEFNYAIEVVNNQFFKEQSELYLKAWEEKKSDPSFSIKTFSELVYSQAITLSTGNYTLSGLTGAPYARWLSLTCTIDNMLREIELVTETDRANRLTNLLAPDLNDYPIAVIRNGVLSVLPTNITSATFTYIKYPPTPFLDYYVTSAGVFTPMAEGATGITIPAGGQYRDGTTGTKSSITVELDYNADMHSEFITLVLKYFSLSLSKQDVEQYMTLQKQEDNAL